MIHAPKHHSKPAPSRTIISQDNDKTSEIEGLKAEVEDLRRRLAERQVTALATPPADGMEEEVEKAKQFDRFILHPTNGQLNHISV